MKKRTKIIIALIIVLIIAFILYKNSIASKNKKKTEQFTVKRGDLKKELTISGKIEADENISLKFQTSGKLTWLGAAEGDYVKKYQVIATIDQRAIKKTLDKYLNTYLKYRWDFDQTNENYKDKAMTDAMKRIVDQSQFDLNNAVSDVEIQNLSVEFSRLVTPIEGIVVKLYSPYAGVNIISTQTIAEIINPKTIYFSASADQTEVISLKEGMKGKLVLDSYPDKTTNGYIKNISFIPKTDEVGTVYSIKFIFPDGNSNFVYKIGMTGDLVFTTDKKNNVLYLPIKFVNTENDKNYVNIKENGKFKKKYVTTGLETDDDIEITAGLLEGNIVYD